MNQPKNEQMTRGRKLKAHVLEILGSADREHQLTTLLDFPSQAVVGPLFSALCSRSLVIRWRAITAFGVVVPAMAKTTPEKARVVMRRFIWSLNDESGGIGWGAPEAMAEIVCHSPLLASEYHHMVLAYIHEEKCRPDCFLEHAPLRRGAMWGVGRLAQVRPDLAYKAEPDLICALTDADAPIRGLAAWACGLLGLTSALPLLTTLSSAMATLELYRDHQLETTTVSALAREATARIVNAQPTTK